MQQALPTVGFLRHTWLAPSETFIYTTLQALDRYRVAVFATRRVAAEKFPTDDLTVLRDGWLGRLEAELYERTAWSPRFVRWARRVRLIHAHMGYTGAYGLDVARRLGLPLITSYYGFDVPLLRSPLREHPGYRRYVRRHAELWARADRLLVLSRHMMADLVAQGVQPERVRIVPLGIDVDRFHRPTPPAHGRRIEVLMIGREVEKKGFDDGLRACALAREAGADLTVRVLGFGLPGQAALRTLAESLALPVEWLDPGVRAWQAMQTADVLLVPSRTAADGDQEGTPTVICEGGAAGLAIVATRHAGIPEQVEDGVSGLLADERDAEGLARHLVAATDPALRAALGAAAVARMRQVYSLTALRHTLQGIYDEVLS